MSLTDNFKRDPVGFLSTGLLITQLNINGGPCKLNIKEHVERGISARLTGGPPANRKMYVLEPAQGGGTLDAAWLPWQDDGICSVPLKKDQRDFLFTFTIDGCSIGIGSPKAGDMLISHANSASVGDNAFRQSKAVSEQGKIEDAVLAQQKAQEKQISDHHRGKSAKVDILAPTLYRMNPETNEFELKGTAFGVRQKDKWAFYVQRYRIDGDTACIYFHPPLKLMEI